MSIIQVKKTPEFLAKSRSLSDMMQLLRMTEAELVAAIEFRPTLALELAQEATCTNLMNEIWSRAKAGLDAQAAERAVEAALSHQSRITL